MAIGSGIGAQLMFAAETTAGTEVTVDHTLEFLDESLAEKPTWLESMGLKSGTYVSRASRLSQSRFTVEGDMSFEALDKGMGLLISNALGSTASPFQIGTTGAYAQRHRLGDPTGNSLTIQIGRPRPSGSVSAHTYRGCKIKSWEFSCSDGEMGKWKFTIDGWRETTATSLATASYLTDTKPFTFAESTIQLGTSATAGTNTDTITGGSNLTTLVKGITIKGETSLATERFGLGNSGVKKEQIINGMSVITAELDAEYTSQTEIYDLFKANTTKSFAVVFQHGNAGGGNAFELGFVMPAVKIKEAAPNVGGPDIVQQKIMLQAYDPELASLTALTVNYVSTDTDL